MPCSSCLVLLDNALHAASSVSLALNIDTVTCGGRGAVKENNPAPPSNQ